MDEKDLKQREWPACPVETTLSLACVTHLLALAPLGRPSACVPGLAVPWDSVMDLQGVIELIIPLGVSRGLHAGPRVQEREPRPMQGVLPE